MDYKQLIADLNDIYENYISELCGNDKLNCADLCIGKGEDCVIVQAISAIEKLNKEREALMYELSLVASCASCKFYEGKHEECYTCGYPKRNWQWRGVAE